MFMGPDCDLIGFTNIFKWVFFDLITRWLFQASSQSVWRTDYDAPSTPYCEININF